MKKLILTLAVLCLASFSSMAARVQLFESLTGSTVLPAAMVPTVTDDEYGSLPATPGFVNHKVKGRVSVGIDHTSLVYQGTALRYRFNLTIDYEDATLTPLTKTIDLDVEYDPFSGLQFKDMSVFELEGAHKIDVTINSITDLGTSSLVTNPADIFFVKAELDIERYYQLVPGSPAFSGTINLSSNELELTWTSITGAEEYDFEWTFINDYGATAGTYIPYTSIYLDMRQNATRIRLKANAYNIPLIYDHGYIVYRIRAVGRNINAIDKEVLGGWSAIDNGMLSSFSNITSTTEFQGKKNWQYSAQYAEGGKKKEVVGYFDGTLRNRQMVTKVNTNDKIIVGETIYDHQGRKAVEVLPVPVTSDVSNQNLRYYENFNLNNAGSPVVYSANDFDTDNGNCQPAPGEMSPSAGASKYYSNNNPDQDAHQAYLPDAEMYPFSQTVYTPDNTGRVASQSGVGPQHQVGTGHETQYLYSRPEQVELDRLFGSEAGNAARYKKNTVIDPNGQISVSYLDQQGRVVATALAGNAPTDRVQEISSYATSTRTINSDMFAKSTEGKSLLNVPDIESGAIRFNSMFTVTTPGVYAFDYAITPETYSESCLPENVCFDCIYQLNITIYDKCFDEVFSMTRRVGKPELNIDCDDTALTFISGRDMPDTGALNLELGVGSYHIVKTLQVDEEAYRYYLQQYLTEAANSCLRTYGEFVLEEKAKLDYSGCNTDCQECETQLGTKDAYVMGGKGTEAEWEAALEACREACAPASACDVFYRQMLSDMSPGGQYAELYNPETGEAEPGKFPLSIFNYDNVLPDHGQESDLPASAFWRAPRMELPDGSIVTCYHDADGTTRSKILVMALPNGGYYPALSSSPFSDGEGNLYTYPEQLIYEADFAAYFQPSWARSLVIYHPEYCYLSWCKGNQDATNNGVSSEAFDEDFLSTETYADANTKGYLNPLSIDPYFNTGGRGFSQASDMSNLVSNYQVIPGAGTLTMKQVAALATRCPNTYGINYDASCLLLGTGVNTAILDAEWKMFRAFYFGEKNKMQVRSAHAWVMTNPCTSAGIDEQKTSYNGCIGKDKFNPFNSELKTAITIADPTHSNVLPYWTNTDKNVCACEYDTYKLYAGKTKRFADVTADLELDPEKAEYNQYYASGSCPIAADMEKLLDAMASGGNLLTTSTLNSYTFFSQRLYSSIIEGSGGTVNPAINEPVRATGSVSGTNLVLTLEKYNSLGYWQGLSCNITLKPASTGSPIVWSLVKGFKGLTYSESLGTTLTVLMDDDANPATPLVEIPGKLSTCFSFDCEFPDQCRSTDFAASIETLMSALANAGELTSSSDVTLNVSASSGGFREFMDQYLWNEFGAEDDLYWQYDAGTKTFTLHDLALVNTLELAINAADLAGLDMNDVRYFSNMKVDTQDIYFGFIITAHYYDGSTWKTRDLRITSSKASIFGSCRAPVPMSCESKEHTAGRDMVTLLQYILKEGAVNTALNTSNALTSTLRSYLGTGEITLASVTESRDKIEGEFDIYPNFGAAPCKLSIFRIHPFFAQENDFRDIEAVLNNSIKLLPETYSDGKAYGFTVKVRFTNGQEEEIGVRTSCIPVQACQTTCNPSEETDPCEAAYSIYLDAIIRFNLGLMGNNPILGEARKYSLVPVAFIDFNCSCPFAYGDYLEEFVDEGEAPLDYAAFLESKCSPLPCEDAYESYKTAVQAYNSGHPGATIPVAENSKDFPCSCISGYITYLENFVPNMIIPKPFSIDRFCCGTPQDLEEMVEVYNSAKHPNDPNPDLNPEIGSNLCLCLESYRLYLEAVTAFNNDPDVVTANLFIQPVSYSGDFPCSCVPGYLDYLQTFTPGSFKPRTISDYCCNSYTTYAAATTAYNAVFGGGAYQMPVIPNDEQFPDGCGCGPKYAEYIADVLTYNQANPGFEVIPVSYESFNCSCVDDYKVYLDAITPVSEAAASITDFCCTDYHKYNQLVTEYNGKYAPDITLRPYDADFNCECVIDYNFYMEKLLAYNLAAPALGFSFLVAEELPAEGYCSCIGEYWDYIDKITSHNENYPDYAIEALPLSEFNCGACWTDYTDWYIISVAEYNIANNASMPILPFDQDFSCDCVIDYSDYLYAISDFNAANPDHKLTAIAYSASFPCSCVSAYIGYLNGLEDPSEAESILTYDCPEMRMMAMSPEQKEQRRAAFLARHPSPKAKMMLMSEETPAPNVSVTRTKRKPCPQEIEAGPFEEIVDRCSEQLDSIAERNAKFAYEDYLAGISAAFRKAYYEKCLLAQEDMAVAFTDREHHYTLYYYDLAGNLVRTVPPAGVVPVTDENDLAAIRADRSNGTMEFYTEHTLQTVYEYNSLNQLIKQSVPDHDKMDILENKSVDISLLLPSGAEVVDMKYVSPNRAYLLANSSNDGYLLRSDDGGYTWTSMDFITPDLKKVFMVTTSVGYAIGDDGLLLKTSNGNDWRIVYSAATGITVGLKDLYFLSTSTGLIIGENGAVKKTTDGGTSWTTPTGLPSGSGRTYSGISFNSGGTHGIISVDNSGSGSVYFTEDSGDSWSADNFFRAGNISAACMIDEVYGYAGGDYGMLLRTDDEGNNWYQIRSDLPFKIEKLYFTDPDNGILLASNGQLYETHNTGATWTVATVIGRYRNFSFYNLTEGIAVGDDGLISYLNLSGTAYIYKLLDINIDVSSEDFLSVHLTEDLYGVVAGKGGVFYRAIYIPSRHRMELTPFTITDPDLAGKDITKLYTMGFSGEIKGIFLAEGVAGTFESSASQTIFTISTLGGLGTTEITDFSSTPDNIYLLHKLPDPAEVVVFIAYAYPGSSGFDDPVGLMDQFNTDVETVPSVIVTPIDNAIYVFGDAGSVFKSDGYGTTYNDFSNKMVPLGFNGAFSGDNNNDYIIGDNGNLFRRDYFTYGAWMMQTTNTHEDLNAIWASDDGEDVAIAGNKGTLITSTDALVTLTHHTGLTKNDFLGIGRGENPGAIYALGRDGAVFRGTIPFSSSFTAFGLPAGFEHKTFYGVHGSTGFTHGIMVGEGGAMLNLTSGPVVVTDQKIRFPLLQDIDLAENTGLIGGVNGCMLRSSDFGGNWKLQRQYSPFSHINAVEVVSDQQQFIVGENSLARYTTNSGQTWSTPAGIASSLSLRDVTYIPRAETVLIAGGGNIYRSVNEGASFTATLTTGTPTMTHIDDFGDVCLAVGTSGRVYRSLNYGASWSPISHGLTSADLYKVEFYDKYTAYAVGATGIMMKTIDGGLNWDIKNAGLSSGVTVKALAIHQRSELFVGGSGRNLSKIHDESDFLSSAFWYDELGRLCVSQNTKQYNKSLTTFSYTVFDVLGRVTEVGEITNTFEMNDVMAISGGYQFPNSFFNDWLNEGTRTEVTRTFYDIPFAGATGLIQENLRKRVASVTIEQTDDGNDLTFDHATHYTYDVHGYVKELVQHNPSMAAYGQATKRILYDYDILSGNLSKLSYNLGETDQYFQKYEYDADRRLTAVSTSRNQVVWDRDAHYLYYDHGPLARLEIGNNAVQGIDYAYTIQGWIKAVNSTSLNPDRDMGHDANDVYPNFPFARDLAAYSLNYFNEDYRDIAQINDGDHFIGSRNGSLFESDFSEEQFNGNVRSMSTSLTILGNAAPQIVAYRYDQFNRLIESRSTDDFISNDYSSIYTVDYENTFRYDAMGNILGQYQTDQTHTSIDSLTYKYDWIDPADHSLGLRSNRLYHVNDQVGSGMSSIDIDDQGGFQPQPAGPFTINTVNNYGYNELGMLIRDNQEEIKEIQWTKNGKIRKVVRTLGSTKPDLEFRYDALDNRIEKIVKPVSGSILHTYYIIDAQGREISSYQTIGVGDLLPKSASIYGAMRIGLDYTDTALNQYPIIGTDTTEYYYLHFIGMKEYEQSNYLGNVLSTFTDHKHPDDGDLDGTINFYYAQALSASDYYAYGTPMVERTFSVMAKYRHGFNGMLHDDELYGEGNAYDFGTRIYSNRLAIFYSPDPKNSLYPYRSTYSFAGNNPIRWIDIKGELVGDPRVIVTNIGTVTFAAGEAITEQALWAHMEAIGILRPVPTPAPGLAYYMRGPLLIAALLIPANLDYAGPGACCGSEMCGRDWNMSCSLGKGEMVRTGQKPLIIYEDDPSKLEDWYLEQVAERVRTGKTESNDLLYYKEYLTRFGVRSNSSPRDILDIAFYKQGKKSGESYLTSFKQKWVEDGYEYEVRVHAADANAPKGSNSASGTTYRIARRKQGTQPGTNNQGYGWEYMDTKGGWHSQAEIKKSNKLANDTHIPMPSDDKIR